MDNRHLTVIRKFFSAVAPLVLFAGLAIAQPKQAPAQPSAPVVTDQDFAATQAELIRLLRLSPKLTTVVARDPSLLANQEYVSRNNPQLAQFLEGHPEVARNPEFYLFTKQEGRGGRGEEALQRAVWPEFVRQEPSVYREFFHDLIPFMVFLSIVLCLGWLVRLLLENRRWTRIFKLQTDVHGKLIDRFGTNQELLTYMDTEAGRRFLEAAPIPMGFETGRRVPSAVARILTPLQIGVVLTLLGLGFLFLRHAVADLEVPMLVLGTATLMPGIGFILSAGITWVLASRLGLMLDSHSTSHVPDMPFDPKGRQ
jgi:hypothetical protein